MPRTTYHGSLQEYQSTTLLIAVLGVLVGGVLVLAYQSLSGLFDRPDTPHHISTPLPHNTCLQHGGVAAVYEDLRSGEVIALCRAGQEVRS